MLMFHATNLNLNLNSLLRDSYGMLQAKNHDFELHLGTPPLGVIVHAKMTEENT